MSSSTGEVIGFEQLVSEVFAFVNTLTDKKNYRKLINGYLSELVHIVVSYAQMTEEQVGGN